MHRIRALRFDADDLDRRTQLFDRVGDACHEAAAADRHDQRIELGKLLAYLESHRAGSHGHLRAFKRMYEEAAFVVLDRHCNVECLVNIVDQDDLCSIGFAGIDPIRIRGPDHDHLRRAAQGLCRKSGGDCVIARTDGRDAPLQLFPRQRVKIGKRAACLEGARPLQEFQLAPYARTVVQREFDPGAAQQRCTTDTLSQNLSEGTDGLDCWCCRSH